MKNSFILFTSAALYLFTACSDGSETSKTGTDTTSSLNNLNTEQPLSPMDTAKSEASLMMSMNGMMSKTQSMQMTGDFDIDFAKMMIEHHQGALDMAEVEISQGKDEEMKVKAQEIISKQKDEQQMLRAFVSSYKPSGMKHGEGELQKSMSGMSSNMKPMQMTGNVDKDFATMMSLHHSEGIAMSKMELKNGMSDKLKQTAQNGIIDQQNDIKELKKWLSANK